MTIPNMVDDPQGDPPSVELVTLTRLPHVLYLAVVAAMSLSLWLLPPPEAAVSVILALTMGAIAVIDATRFRIPDWLSLPAIPIGIAAGAGLHDFASPPSPWVEHIFAAIAAGALLWLVRWAFHMARGVHGLGLGDVKLGAAAGAWVGAVALPQVLLLACGLGILIVAVLQMQLGRRAIRPWTGIPFGAVLAPAIWIIWFTERLLQLT